ncbi:hypothetical protein [Thiohalomonas denitrificans]|uniref:hypothetical protein n=1 Tax=Thiohalomonas denitrificans TaxID=415747 RepID=UPI0026ECF55F|nr:hypothetical protein [Thiohalomonas denitrificans]
MEDRSKIHFSYAIAILLAVIVVLISVEWSKVSGLIEYITFALTLSSLILAILAIIYSMVSNSSFNDIIQRLNTSSGHLEHTSKGIDESNRILLEEIKKIPNAIELVDRNILSTQNMIENLSPSKLTETREESEVSKEISSKVVEGFVEESSIRGLQALYCLVLSNKTKTAFAWKEICEEVPSLKNSEQYLMAYYIAAKALGLLNVDYDGKFRIIVEEVHSVLLGSVEVILEKKLEEAAKESIERQATYKECINEEEMELWLRNLTEIKEYFGVIV